MHGGSGWVRVDEAEAFARMLGLYREGKVDEDEFRRFRLQHGTYSSRFQKEYSMIRVKVPGGALTPEQIERTAEVAERFSIGSAHVSTRQDLQLHWVLLDDVPEVMRSLAEVGLTTREACGNTVRNITCSPLAGVCPYEPFDVTSYAQALAGFLLRNPTNQSLPRKFKINFSCCEKHGLAKIGDIGVIPMVTLNGEGVKTRGFRIYFGGGLGPASYVAEAVENFTTEEELLLTCIAVIRLFDRYGDREKMHRNRMRYLVHDLGFSRFRSMIIKERGVVRATLPPGTHLQIEAQPSPSSPEANGRGDLPNNKEDYSRWLLTNVLPQKQSGFHLVFLTLPAGDISADQLRAVSKICRRYSTETSLRTSLTQSMVFRWVAEGDIPSVYQELTESGLASPGGLTIASTIGCSGTTSCNLALTNSHRLGKEIQRRILELNLDMDEGLRDASVKISGCPNSCGQHEIATIGFFGGAMRINGAQVPTYTMLIGGGLGEDARLGEVLMRVPAKRAVDAVVKVVEIYRNERFPGENLNAWVQRVMKGEGTGTAKNIDDLRKQLQPVATVPNIDIDPDAYVDWGSEVKYHTKTSKGECAA